MDKNQEQEIQSQSSEQKTTSSPTPQLSASPVLHVKSCAPWKTVVITVGIVIVVLLVLGIAIRGQRLRRLKEWRERKQQKPTIYQQSTTVSSPNPTLIPGQPTLTPTPSASAGITYKISVTEAEWNNRLKDRVAETQNNTYPLTLLTVSLYKDSGQINAAWTTGAAYTAELYVDETGKELRLRNSELIGAGSLNEDYRNSATDVFQTEITAAVKSHFSNRLDYIELHLGKIMFFYN